MSHVQSRLAGFLTLSIFDQQSVCPVCYLYRRREANTQGLTKRTFRPIENASQQIHSGVREIRYSDFGCLILTRPVCPWILREPFGADFGGLDRQ
jgi:hypothetical protein